MVSLVEIRNTRIATNNLISVIITIIDSIILTIQGFLWILLWCHHQPRDSFENIQHDTTDSNKGNTDIDADSNDSNNPTLTTKNEQLKVKPINAETVDQTAPLLSKEDNDLLSSNIMNNESNEVKSTNVNFNT